MKDINEYYERLCKKIINVVNGFDLLGGEFTFMSDLLSDNGKFKMELFDELDCCIRPNSDDEPPVSIEEFKENLVRHIEYIRERNYYDHTIKEFDYRVARSLQRYARKFGIESAPIE